MANETNIPKFPRHLSKSEREAVLQKAAADFLEGAVRACAADLGRSEAAVRKDLATDAHVMRIEQTIFLRWLDERIEALENEGQNT
jgi:hypothetical protein